MRYLSFLAVLGIFIFTSIAQAQPVPKKLQELRLTPPIPTSKYKTDYKENDAGLEKHHLFLFRGLGYALYTYYSYTPKSLKSGRNNPAIILLHGAGRTGVTMGEMWKKTAERHGIQLFAPTGQGHQWFRDNASDKAMIKKLMAKIIKDPSVDPSQIYIFGHSDGAGAALWLGADQSENLAAVGIHAGTIRDKAHFAAIKSAKRKIPYCIFIGSNDRTFPLKHVRHAAQLIAHEGHDTVLIELYKHNHWYYTLADWINDAAWGCMTSAAKKK